MLRPFALVTPSTRGPSVAMTGRPPVKTESPVYATYRQGHPEKINRAPSSFGRSQPRLMMIHLDLEDERTIRSAANNLGEILPPQPGNYAKNLQGQHLLSPPPFTKHFTARVGSIGDNREGGWYSYRASKATLSQTMHIFDLQLIQTERPTMAVIIHPGTVKTDSSKGFWDSVPGSQVRKPEEAAEYVPDIGRESASQSLGLGGEGGCPVKRIHMAL